MGFGALATIAVAQPRNLDVVVLDNEQFGETGMQASHTGQGDRRPVAAACGFAETGVLRDLRRGDVCAHGCRLPGAVLASSSLKVATEPAAIHAGARRGLHQEPVPGAPRPGAS